MEREPRQNEPWLESNERFHRRSLTRLQYVTQGGFCYARHTRNWILTITASIDRDSSGKDLLVGGSEIRSFSEAGKAVGAMHGVAGQGHTGVDHNLVRAGTQ